MEKENNYNFYNYFNNFKYLNITKNHIIILTKSDFFYFNEICSDLLNYKWEIMPKKYILNHLRYIIKNYYNKSCLKIFDKSLNQNFYNYIKNNALSLSSEKLNDLISKSKI